MRKAWVSLMSMFIFISILSMLSIPTNADLITTVTVDINEDELAVDVSPGSRRSVTFTGTIDAENYNTAVPLVVDLWAESTLGDAWVSPPKVVFEGDKHSDDLQCTIEVPFGTSASEDHSYTISGIWQQGGRSGDVEGDTCKIIILPYYLPVISCESQYKNIQKGESAIFDILLNNSGNTDDVVRVEIVNKEELKAHGFNIYEISDITIAENTSKEFKLRASTSKDALDRHSIEVTATSIRDEYPNSDTLILMIQAREMNPIETLFDPMVLTIIAVVIIVGIVVFVKKR